MITREQLCAWGACYDDDQIAAIVPAEGLTPLQVCDLDIPADDRLWVVLRESVIPAGPLRLLACKWARVALDAERAVGREPDPRSWAAIDVGERFARGEATAEELAAARAAAWAAASAAAWGAARDAAWAAASAAASAAARDAAWDAARDAASAAARAAAWDAAWDAARAAARAAAKAAQLADCRAWIAAQRGG